MNRVLLIVDDWPQVARSLRRCLKHGFDTVHVATSVAEAEQLLASGVEPPTHLLCDCFLGEDMPLGTELIPKWRSQCPSLQSAVLITGSDLGLIKTGPGIDAVFRKPFDVTALRRFFGVPEPVE